MTNTAAPRAELLGHLPVGYLLGEMDLPVSLSAHRNPKLFLYRGWFVKTVKPCPFSFSREIGMTRQAGACSRVSAPFPLHDDDDISRIKDRRRCYERVLHAAARQTRRIYCSVTLCGESGGLLLGLLSCTVCCPRDAAGCGSA